MSFSNGLTPAEHERLSLLLEEMGETTQVIGKILRHGYESYDPTGKVEGTNRQGLVRELGDVLLVMEFLTNAQDIEMADISKRIQEKRRKVIPYLHYQDLKVIGLEPDPEAQVPLD